MKLATIIPEQTVVDDTDDSPDIAMPTTWREADRLFDEGMAAAESGDRQRAYRIFRRLADYDGEGPPELRDSAKRLRDFYDPDASPEARAKLARRTLPAQVFSIDTSKGTVTHWQESSDREASDSERASLWLDPPTIAWVLTNDLIASAFRALERGDLDEADRIFAEFLDRTEDEPSAALRATAMIARREISLQREAKTCEAEST